jgi:hypothetical protein
MKYRGGDVELYAFLTLALWGGIICVCDLAVLTIDSLCRKISPDTPSLTHAMVTYSAKKKKKTNFFDIFVVTYKVILLDVAGC